jgi:hypothetical protein
MKAKQPQSLNIRKAISFQGVKAMNTCTRCLKPSKPKGIADSGAYRYTAFTL